MRSRNLLIGFTAAASMIAAIPANASVIYQSIPDLTVAPSSSWCSPCNIVVSAPGESIGQTFILGTSATATGLTFAVDPGYNPGSWTVGIYSAPVGGVGTLGNSIFNQTFTSFSSDVLTTNGSELLSVNLGGVPLSAGTTYDLFLTGPVGSDAGVLGYYGIGPGAQVYVANGSIPPAALSDVAASVVSYDSGILLSAPAGKPAEGWLDFGVISLLLAVAARYRGLIV